METENQDRIQISVIIPSYNRANTVGETIESIMAQDGIGKEYDLEVVIGDDCSTDNAREVLEQYHQKYPDYIRLFFREQNMRLGGNWAQCVKDCRGKYICNCDNDDYWHNPRKLLIQLAHMESHLDCNICITDHRTHNRTTGKIREGKAYIDRSKPIQKAMWGGSSFCNATIMYRADFMKAHLDLDEFIRRRLTLQDWPAWVILTAYTDIDILPVSTATFGVETVSITRPDSVEYLAKRHNDDKEVCRYLGELFPNEFPYKEEWWTDYSNGRLLVKAFELGQFKYAKKYGKLCADLSGMKRFCSQHWLAFYVFVLGKKVKKRLKGI